MASSKVQALRPVPSPREGGATWDGSPIRPTVATVDLGALARNHRTLARAAAPAGLLAVVKGDAYGHGAVACSRILAREGAAFLGVALTEEALVLRREGIAAPILVMGGAYGDRYDLLVGHGLTPLVFRPEHLEGLAAAARAAGARAVAHVKIDTGMGRIGVLPEDLAAFADAARALGVELEGAASHLARAETDDAATTAQLGRFEAAVALLRARGFSLPWVHLANSAALVRRPDTRGSLARPGVMLYGLPPAGVEAGVSLEPVLRFTTEVGHLKRVPEGTPISYGGRFVTARPSVIATLPVGYADGYDRHLEGKGEVLVRGRRAPVVGAVCMDQTLVDVTDVPGAAVGDEVVLVGRQGDDEVTALELAAHCGTIHYEILSGISARVPRRYVGG